ncbi:MAG: hypothetical protein M1821_002513 [Bathelium mastoideum]|nr:MAG: hypothetical protein M1821_002513 [Bathelium mastoideum]
MVTFNYLVPALYLNATVQQIQSLGNLSTGGPLAFGKILSGNLYSEPGFEPSFTATLSSGVDFVTIDSSNNNIRRPGVSALVQPDDGDLPFEVQIGGIQFGTTEEEEITFTNTSRGLSVPYGSSYSVWLPTFRGGSAKYENLQQSVFVGSETVSNSDTPGEFLLGLKISKVFATETNITIGEEFP